ncbi:MAG TPA: thiamine pyrophosphate-dependent enzyme [Anaerolineales bacterium]|nr:thiamine pyrophosphate-dependent enzyme [Anaerolineales bacterium]
MTPTTPNWIQAARQLLLSRQIDNLEIDSLVPQGKIKYQFSAHGHELAQVLLAQALDHPHDAATVYYRSRPFVLASGLSPTAALAAGMARAAGPTLGRDVGVMFNLPSRGGITIFPTSGDVGAQYTPAVGWAQAIQYRTQVMRQAEWQNAIAVALGGDGSVAANGFWAALNIVTTLKLPYLFFIEDNSYGISVPSAFQVPEGNVAQNLTCYGGLCIRDGSGSQPDQAWQAISSAVEYVRSGAGPCLLRLRVPRLLGHTYVDNQAYKSAQQRAEEAARDPLVHLKDYLEAEKIFTAAQWQALEQEVAQEIDAALHAAEETPQPEPASALHHRFFEGVAPHQGGLRPEGANLPLGPDLPQPSGPRINLIDAVRRTLEVEMTHNPRLLVFGEDVGVKGGVHGATHDMQHHFGPERVFDTSLNEDGIIGRSIGMALAGLLPVPEIQFRKYADPAHEQINDLGFLRWRTANHFAAPVIVRIPVGFSKKTGDPWHSFSAEAVYAHTLGWRIAFPSNAEDAVGLLRTALRGDDPTFFFEHRALLDTPEGRRPYPGDAYCLPFGRAARLLEGRALTIVTWGAMVGRCLEAAQNFPGQVDLFDLRTIIPWDQEAVLESVHHTGKALIVHEDTLTSGFGAEISAIIAEQAFNHLDAPIARLATPDVPIPYNIPMMDAVLPTAARIQERIQTLLAY